MLRTHPGFTLIELLVVIAIIAVLAVVVILALNPAELLKQSRDATRLSDLSTLNSVINIYQSTLGGSSGYSLGSSSVAFVSIPDPTAPLTGNGCTGLGGTFPVNTGFFGCAASSTYKNASTSGWLSIAFNQIPSGSPLGSLPVDPINTTSSNLNYSYENNGSTFILQAKPESQKYSALFGTNPNEMTTGSNPDLYGSWVFVPGNTTFGTSNFYVMKYLASCQSVGSGISQNSPVDQNGYRNNQSASVNCMPVNGLSVASRPNAIPVVDITQASSSDACSTIGGHLMSNAEWQTLAWNLEAVASNWSGGTVGSGSMPSGHNNNFPPNQLAASNDDTQGYFGETTTSTSQWRILTLSTGANIWDVAGNIYETLSDQIQGQNQPSTGSPGFIYRDWTAITTWGTVTQQSIGPSNASWNHNQGVGSVFSDGTPGNTTVYSYSRGGRWDLSTAAGVENISMGAILTRAGNDTGLRCVR